MKNTYLILMIIIILSHKGKAQEVQSPEDCVFDNNLITDSFLKTNNNIYSYKWDNNLKIASIILKDNSILTIKISACVHYSVEMEMMVMVNCDFAIEDWKLYFIKMMEILPDKAIISLVSEKLKNEEIELKKEGAKLKEIFIPDEWYLEFYLDLMKSPNGYIFSISYYRN